MGVENTWSAWSENSDKEYFNLPAGEYTFQVESKFGKQSADVNFEIQPHWTRSWWAYFLYFLGFMALIGVFQFYQKRKFEIAKRKIKEEQKHLLLEQQMKADNEKLQMDIVNKSKQLANSTMNLVQKNEILLQIKNELLQLKKKSTTPILGKDYQQLLHIIDLHKTQKFSLWNTDIRVVKQRAILSIFPDMICCFF